MGPDGAVNILFRKQLAAAATDEERDALRAQLVAGVKAQIDPFLSAKMGFVDDIIDPADTRRHIIHGLEVSVGKRLRRPPRKRGVVPV
jgi:acetyl-CoA carboxylase carboxyltransferase component